MGVVVSGQSSGQWSVVSGQHAQADFSSSSPATNHQPPATSRRRSGITLLEVLISMGVLLIGLMGVGAMIPAGRYEIMQGVKTDYATTVGRAAFRDLKARGYLNPRSWRQRLRDRVLAGHNAVYRTAWSIFRAHRRPLLALRGDRSAGHLRPRPRSDLKFPVFPATASVIGPRQFVASPRSDIYPDDQERR